jgi:hypothetical protein
VHTTSARDTREVIHLHSCPNLSRLLIYPHPTFFTISNLYLHNPWHSFGLSSFNHSLTHSLTHSLLVFINITFTFTFTFTFNNHNVISILPTSIRGRTWLSFFLTTSVTPTTTTDNTKLLTTNIHLLRLLDLIVVFVLTLFLHIRLPNPLLNGSTTTPSRYPSLLKMRKMRRDNQCSKKWRRSTASQHR